MTHAATNFFRGRNFTMANKLLLSVTAVALASAALVSSPAAAQNRQQKAQAAGDYGTINDSYMDPVGAIQNAWNNPGANKAPNQETPGYNRIEYRPDRVIPLRLREAMNTTIGFPAEELIEEFYVRSERTTHELHSI